jgi:hypothetical protein
MSPESEAFVLQLESAWRDWIADGARGANGANGLWDRRIWSGWVGTGVICVVVWVLLEF